MSHIILHCMRFGIVILPEPPWRQARQRWQAAEDLGFDHAWTYDHLAWGSLAGRPWGATIPVLTAAALATTRIRLGTFVSNPNFRHPVPFAKELATVEEMADGRITLGVGAGVSAGADAVVLCQPEYGLRQRHERFTEFVGLLDGLLRFETEGGAGIDSDGTWFSARAARMVGTPAQRPRMPIAVAANGPKGMELAARLGDGWITNGPQVTSDDEWWKRIARLAAQFDETCERLGRDPRLVDRHLSVDAVEGERFPLRSVKTFEEAVGRAADLGFTDLVVHWPRESGVYAGSERVLADIASRFDRLR
jgi:alkanesulfonate monooxygenase SsuD/methylene tetrahydromethanopterin reductase-like flavin-dependent oxidoreductase (luciferase family)